MTEERLIPIKSIYPTKHNINKSEYEHVKEVDRLDSIDKKVLVAEDKSSGSFFLLYGHPLVYRLSELHIPEVLAEITHIKSEEELSGCCFENGGRRIQELRILKNY